MRSEETTESTLKITASDAGSIEMGPQVYSFWDPAIYCISSEPWNSDVSGIYAVIVLNQPLENGSHAKYLIQHGESSRDLHLV